MGGENILETLQKVVTVSQRVDALTVEVRDLRAVTTARLDKAEAIINDLRERLARLEASRDADKAQAQADLARFKAEVERAEMRLTRTLPPAE